MRNLFAETLPESLPETLSDPTFGGTAAQFGQPSVDLSWLFIKTILAMVLVIALAVIILRYLLPRLSLSKVPKGNGDFEILQRYPLDSKKILYVVRIENRRLLLSATEQQVALVTELENDAGEDSR